MAFVVYFTLFLVSSLTLSLKTHAKIDEDRSEGSYHVPLSKKNLQYRTEASTQPISNSNGFWFGSFTVGASFNLTMLIDTGSTDVIVNSGLYKPSTSSLDIYQGFTSTYGTTASDGTGNGEV